MAAPPAVLRAPGLGCAGRCPAPPSSQNLPGGQLRRDQTARERDPGARPSHRAGAGPAALPVAERLHGSRSGNKAARQPGGFLKPEVDVVAVGTGLLGAGEFQGRGTEGKDVGAATLAQGEPNGKKSQNAGRKPA